jgi:hypothetical protein
MSTPALAEFSRSFIPSLTLEGTTGPSGEGVPFGGLVSCIAIDTGEGGKSSGHIWVGVGGVIDEYDSSGKYLQELAGLEVNGCAFDDLNEKLYTVGLKEWVAVDNSNSQETGDIYFARQGNDAGPGSVARENPEGEPVDFECSEADAKEYIRNGNELIGRPGENGEPIEYWSEDHVAGVTVDSGSGQSAGYIYVLNNKSFHGLQIDEFTSTGCFVGAITGIVEVGQVKEELFSRRLGGVAVDPTDGDILTISLYGDAVDEFASSGEYLGKITGTSKNVKFEEGAFYGGGIAVDSSGDLYVGVRQKGKAKENNVDVFGPGAFYPDTVTGAVTSAQPTSVILNGEVRGVTNTELKNLILTECEFEYITEKTFQQNVAKGKGGFSNLTPNGEVPCVPDLEGKRLGEENYPVHTKIDGLESGTVYRYRLVAGTKPGERGGINEEGSVESFAAPAAPAVESASVDDVSSSWADFHAVIDPVGSDTTYQFEYVTEEAFQKDGFGDLSSGGNVPIPAADIGSGDTGVSVNAQAGNLSAGTLYHFRVVAENAIGAAPGGPEAEGAFATLPSAVQGLPDGRGYEMMTPPNKEDAEDLFGGQGGPSGEAVENYDRGYASEDGDHFLLHTAAAFGSFPASGEDFDVFSRGLEGWSVQTSVSPSLGIQSLTGAVYDSAAFSMIGVTDHLGAVTTNSPDAGLVGPPGGPYVTIASGTSDEPVNIVGASADLGHLVVETRGHDLPTCESQQQTIAKMLDEKSIGLYEWSAENQCLSLVDVKSRSEGGGLISRCGAVLGLGSEFGGESHDAVSADGSRVLFTAPDPEGTGSECWSGSKNAPQLYTRVDGETIRISAPENGVVPKTTYPAVYVGASQDGSKVFFLTRTELTRSAEKLGTTKPELYEYNANGNRESTNWWERKLVRISGGEAEGAVGNVLDVPEVSADGSTVYFNAEGELTPKAHGGLYRYDTDTGKTTYVLPPQSYPTDQSEYGTSGETELGGRWYSHELTVEETPGLWVEANWYTTHDGRFLIFPSSSDITGYDSNGQRELYRYDAEDQSIVCISCNPNGSTPSNGAAFTRSALNGDNPAGTAPRPISENGEYAFFDTAESLVPGDTNGKIDVYEWHAGTISLITTGQDTSDSFFLDSGPYTNAEGEVVGAGNVFFGTHAKLVPADTDSQGDLYDARIDGGFPSPIGVGPCEGDACQNPPPAPIDPTQTLLPSLGVSMSEAPPLAVPNAVVKKAVRCTKGRRLSHGKCVKIKVQGKARKVKSSDRGRG